MIKNTLKQLYGKTGSMWGLLEHVSTNPMPNVPTNPTSITAKKSQFSYT